MGKDILSYNNVGFLLCLVFWQRYKKYGCPKSDWRKLTVQQITVIELFDALGEKYGAKNGGK